MFQDAADGTEGVPFCFQVYRGSAGQYQGAVVDGFVVVPVEEDDVPGGEDRIQHYLIGSGGAIQYEVGLVCVVDPGCMFLGCQCRTFMDKEVPHGYIGIAQVCAECIFTEEIIESAAGGVFPEEGAALVAWAVKLGVSVFYVFFQVLEERRQHGIFVMGCGAFDLAVVEIMVRIVQVDDPVYFADHFISHGAFLRADKEYRNPESKDHFLCQHIGIRIGDHYSTYIGEVRIIHTHCFAAGDFSENFNSPVGISNFQMFHE